MSSQPAAVVLAGFSSTLNLGDIPPRVVEIGAQHMLDVLGAGLAGAGIGSADHALTVGIAQGGTPESSVIGCETRLPAPLAAFVNGTLSHALEFDDTHEGAIAHVSAVVAPAALAASEAHGASGADALVAYIAGVEVIGRLGVAAKGLYARGFHPTSVLGVFGATAAAARACGADQTTTVNALGIAGSFASGLFAYLDDGSATKPLHAGWAAQAGVYAVSLALAGATGPARVIESRFGLFSSHLDQQPDLAPRLDDLGEIWESELVSMKAYPACHFIHAPVAQAADLIEGASLTPSDIESIVVAIPDQGVGLVLDPIEAKYSPRTSPDAKFSLPYCLATRVITGRLDVLSFDLEAITNQEVLSLARRVTARPWGDSPAPSQFAGQVEIITTNGERLSSLASGPPGIPSLRMSPEEVFAKYSRNATLLLDQATAEHLCVSMLALKDQRDIGALLEAVRVESGNL